MGTDRPFTSTAAADVVGAVSTVLGGVLLLPGDAGGRWLGLEKVDGRRRRELGALDLGLGIAILASRATTSRWAIVAARTLLHLVFAREYVRAGNRIAAGGMGALFAVDAGIAVSLRNPGPKATQRVV